MRKIPTALVRDPDDRAHVLPQITAGCEWVFRGEGTATRKWDGTCFRLDSRGRWWARREVKPGRETPPDYITEERDRQTGVTYGWEPWDRSPFATSHATAVRALRHIPRPGTFELLGPRINGNPESVDRPTLVVHGAEVVRELDGVVYPDALAAWDYWREHLLARPERIEGVVFHHPDGRRAKIKSRDFPPLAPASKAVVPPAAAAALGIMPGGVSA